MMSNRESVRAKAVEVLAIDAGRVSDDAILVDLVNSSFLLVELVIELQEEFGVRFQQTDMNGVTTVGQLLDLVTGRMDGGPGD